jgi:hypothetical protein
MVHLQRQACAHSHAPQGQGGVTPRTVAGRLLCAPWLGPNAVSTSVAAPSTPLNRRAPAFRLSSGLSIAPQAACARRRVRMRA